MKRSISNLFFVIIAVMMLGACSSSSEEMNQASGDEKTCVQIKDILTSAEDSNKKKLVIYDPVDMRDKGIVTWLSDKITSMVRTASLKIYLKIALNLDFRFAVAIMMTLAVIMFTASVILGLTQANGYNALVFLLKLIIIYQLSINYYYFDVYVIESFEGLISDAMMFTAFTFSDYAGPTAQSICLGVIGAACDPVGILSSIFGLQAIGDLLGLLGIPSGPGLNLTRITLFGAIDDQLGNFFNFDYWKIILAVSVTGVTGFFWALMMVILVITYFFAIILAVKTFLMATIARYVLYGLGPIFLSFALFNQTRSLFDGWLQQLISFTLQPIFIFIFLGMFHTILQGFTSKMYIDLKGSLYNMEQECLPNSANCVEKDCKSCPGGKKWVSEDKVELSGMCIKWDSIDKESNLNWWKLCDKADSCNTPQGLSPAIPIDIWSLISGIVICYLMGAMCSWVVDIANTLAGGAITLSDVKIQGWDRLKGQMKQGVNSGVNSMFTPRSGIGKGGPGGG